MKTNKKIIISLLSFFISFVTMAQPSAIVRIKGVACSTVNDGNCYYGLCPSSAAQAFNPRQYETVITTTNIPTNAVLTYAWTFVGGTPINASQATLPQPSVYWDNTPNGTGGTDGHSIRVSVTFKWTPVG